MYDSFCILDFKSIVSFPYVPHKCIHVDQSKGRFTFAHKLSYKCGKKEKEQCMLLYLIDCKLIIISVKMPKLQQNFGKMCYVGWCFEIKLKRASSLCSTLISCRNFVCIFYRNGGLFVINI
ncbi:hypothetical protein R6Q59_034911 [Mikania micrantha]